MSFQTPPGGFNVATIIIIFKNHSFISLDVVDICLFRVCYEGQSPYDIITYRYPPAIACLLLFPQQHLSFLEFGKVSLFRATLLCYTIHYTILSIIYSPFLCIFVYFLSLPFPSLPLPLSLSILFTIPPQLLFCLADLGVMVEIGFILDRVWKSRGKSKSESGSLAMTWVSSLSVCGALCCVWSEGWLWICECEQVGVALLVQSLLHQHQL